jgi:hypothetical protein
MALENARETAIEPLAGFDSLRHAPFGKLRTQQDKPLSQLETRDCALSEVEGHNLGGKPFLGITDANCLALWFDNRLLRRKTSRLKRLRKLSHRRLKLSRWVNRNHSFRGRL